MIVFQLLLSFQNEPVRKLKETKQEIRGSSLLHPSPRVTGVEKKSQIHTGILKTGLCPLP
jgi:hypothetical protein